MKELSIEEKAKAYDEAKARMNIAYNSNRCTIGFMNEIFPELKESEDEKIRKEMLQIAKESEDSFYMVMTPNKREKLIAWLEKQGTPAKLSEEEQNRFAKGVLTSCALSFIDYLDAHKYEGKMCVSNGECEDIENAFHNAMWDRLHRYYCKYIEKQGEHNPTDKVEPKFHEGEWITNGDYTWKIVEVKSLNYILQSQDGNIVDDTISHVDEQFHSFTIEDAKDGDVLSYRDGQWCFIYKGIVTEDTFKYYALLSEKDITVNDAAFSLLTSCIIPATKEQRDTLFTKMKEAGYEWDAEKKELRKIEQKPAKWTHKDGKNLAELWEILSVHRNTNSQVDNLMEWVKDLVSYKRREWSEEDENINECIQWTLIDKQVKEKEPNKYNREINWLKSLGHQSQWKPSEVQMEALADALSLAKNCGEENAFDLRTLYEQLKKLREE